MDNDKKKPPFTADWLFSTVQALRQEFGLTVKALFLDYLQIMPVLSEQNRTAEVSSASKSAKALAKDIGCPVFAGVQASREADRRKDMMPIWSDAQHASQIEQDSTKQLSISNPIKHLEAGELIEVGNRFYQVRDELTIVRILKQRGERGAGTYAVSIDPTMLEIRDVTITTLET